MSLLDATAPADSYESALVMANAVQCATNVIGKVAGNDIADGIGGAAMTQDEISHVLAAKINSYLLNPNKIED